MSYKFKLAAFALSAWIAFTNISAQAQETYDTDQSHTELLFQWNHSGVALQHGEFTKVTGVLNLVEDALEKSEINVTINTASISTGYEPLDDVLKGSEWFNVEKYPEATFKSTSIEVTGEKTAKITGDLTIRSITKPVVLDATLTHYGPHPVAQYVAFYKGQWAAFSATTEIRHQAFGVGPYSMGGIKIQIHTKLKAR